MPKFSHKLKSLFYRLYPTAIRFLLSYLLALKINVDDFGLYGMAGSLISYGILLVGMELYSPVNRKWQRKASRKFILSNVVSAYVPAYVIFGSLFYYILQLYVGIWWVSLIIVFVIIFEHISIEIYRLKLLEGLVNYSALITFLRGGLWPTIAVLSLVFFNFGITDVFIIRVIFGFIISFWLVWREKLYRLYFYKSIKTSYIVLIFKTALPFAVYTVTNKSVLVIDKIILSNIENFSAVGVYTLYVGFAGSLVLVLDSVFYSFTLHRLVRANKSDSAEFKRLSIFVIYVGLILSIVLSIVSLGVSYLVLRTLDDIYISDPISLVLIFLAYGFLAASSGPHQILYAAGKDRQLRNSGIIVFLSFVSIFSYLYYYFEQNLPGLFVVVCSIFGAFLIQYFYRTMWAVLVISRS